MRVTAAGGLPGGVMQTEWLECPWGFFARRNGCTAAVHRSVRCNDGFWRAFWFSSNGINCWAGSYSDLWDHRHAETQAKCQATRAMRKLGAAKTVSLADQILDLQAQVICGEEEPVVE